MMKYFSTVVLIVLSFSAQSQTISSFGGVEFSRVSEGRFLKKDPCSQDNPSANFQFFSDIFYDLQLIAADISVPANEIFNLDQIIVNLSSEEGVNLVQAFIWTDDNGLPGEVIMSQDISPTQQNLIGVSPVNYNVYETFLDISTPFELTGGSNGYTYWLQLYGYASSTSDLAVGWESTFETVVGSNLAVRNETGEWVITGGPQDCVYILNGDCEPTLSTDEIDLFNRISLYPNPTKDITFVSGIQNDQIVSIDVHDINGKNYKASIRNAQINLEFLQSGLYFVTFYTQRGRVTKKIVKN